MKNRLKSYIENIIINDDLRSHIQMIIMTVLLSFVSFTMFIVNIFAEAKELMIITGAFSIISIIATFILVFYKGKSIASYIISVSALLMYTAFIITGGIEGFSPIWLCLLPSTGMFFLGMKRGTEISMIMLVVIIVLLWTPFDYLLNYQYTVAFSTRFPIVYASCFVIAYSLEYTRVITYNKMRQAMDQLEQLGKVDELTKINNRRYFDAKLNELWDLMIRANGQISMLMIDVDYFKRYNDHYGHLAGDNVLVEIANAISVTVCRNNDIVARWGGEEFAVLLPLTDKFGALTLASDIIGAVRGKKIPHGLTDLPDKHVTISVGIASMCPNPTYSSVQLVELADKSLYDAKKSGRNRTGQFMNIETKML